MPLTNMFEIPVELQSSAALQKLNLMMGHQSTTPTLQEIIESRQNNELEKAKKENNIVTETDRLNAEIEANIENATTPRWLKGLKLAKNATNFGLGAGAFAGSVMLYPYASKLGPKGLAAVGGLLGTALGMMGNALLDLYGFNAGLTTGNAVQDAVLGAAGEAVIGPMLGKGLNWAGNKVAGSKVGNYLDMQGKNLIGKGILRVKSAIIANKLNKQINNTKLAKPLAKLDLLDGYLFHNGHVEVSPAGYNGKKYTYILREAKPGALKIEEGKYKSVRQSYGDNPDLIWWDAEGHNYGKKVYVTKLGNDATHVMSNLEDLPISQVIERYEPSYYVTKLKPVNSVIEYTFDPVSGVPIPHMPGKVLNNKMSYEEILTHPVLPQSKSTPTKTSLAFFERLPAKISEAERLGIHKDIRNNFFKNSDVTTAWRGTPKAYTPSEHSTGMYGVTFLSPSKDIASAYGIPHQYAFPDNLKLLDIDFGEKAFNNIGTHSLIKPNPELENAFNIAKQNEFSELKKYFNERYYTTLDDKDVELLSKALHLKDWSPLYNTQNDMLKYFYNRRQGLDPYVMILNGFTRSNLIPDDLYLNGQMLTKFTPFTHPELPGGEFNSIDEIGRYIESHPEFQYDGIRAKNIVDFGKDYTEPLTQLMLKKTTPIVFVKKSGGSISTKKKNKGKFAKVRDYVDYKNNK